MKKEKQKYFYQKDTLIKLVNRKLSGQPLKLKDTFVTFLKQL